MVWSKNLCKVFGIDFHFNLNFGKHGSEVNQRIHNSDTDAGIVPNNEVADKYKSIQIKRK